MNAREREQERMREIADLRDRVKFYQEERDTLRTALTEALDVLGRLIGRGHPDVERWRALLPAVKP